MQLRGYPPDGTPALSYVGTPTGSIIGSAPMPVDKIISVPGLQGPVGPPNILTVGTVVSGSVAAADITGTAPAQTLNLTLPKGDKGDKGDTGTTGATGPANVLTVGTVVNGGSAAATITGTSPAQVLNLTLPQGPTGPTGATGPVGTTDYNALTNVPSTFPPSAHTHTESDVTGLTADLAAKESTAHKGVANGYAPLDANALIAAVYLPSYVDDVVEYSSLSGFPTTGETGKIYVADDTGKIYRWSGSTYIEISPSPGSTDSVTEGSTNKYYTDARVATKVAAMFGSTAGTVTQGNDSRLSDTRTPTAGTVPCDFVWVAQSGTRVTGVGDLATGMYVGRAFTVDAITFQFDSADASGSTSVEIRKNGSQVVGSNLSVTAANQADGTSTDSARTATLTDSSRAYSIGDRFALACTAIGTTPGKGLRVYVKGRWT